MSWSTNDEIDFIDKLGSHRSSFKYYDKTYRLRLLNNYVSAIPLRVNWEKMNKQDIISYAKKQLEVEQHEIAVEGILT